MGTYSAKYNSVDSAKFNQEIRQIQEEPPPNCAHRRLGSGHGGWHGEMGIQDVIMVGEHGHGGQKWGHGNGEVQWKGDTE